MEKFSNVWESEGDEDNKDGDDNGYGKIMEKFSNVWESEVYSSMDFKDILKIY
jgi:hypothetical protein